MNIFNRIIMVVVMLCLIVFSIVAIVNIFFNMFEWSSISDSITSYAANQNPYILIAILFLVLVVSLTILIFEFYRRKIKLVNIYTDPSGKTMVTLKNSATQIRERLISIQDVIDPQVKVVPRQNGIIINIFSKLISGISVTDKTKEIREAATNFAIGNLGFKVLQTNYTASGFVTKKAKVEKVIKVEDSRQVMVTKPQEPKEVMVIKEEVPEEVKQDGGVENNTEY